VRWRAGCDGPAWGGPPGRHARGIVDLPAEPGVQLWFMVKAAEVVIHPVGRAP
jgi:hypothetical protein